MTLVQVILEFGPATERFFNGDLWTHLFMIGIGLAIAVTMKITNGLTPLRCASYTAVVVVSAVGFLMFRNYKIGAAAFWSRAGWMEFIMLFYTGIYVIIGIWAGLLMATLWADPISKASLAAAASLRGGAAFFDRMAHRSPAMLTKAEHTARRAARTLATFPPSHDKE